MRTKEEIRTEYRRWLQQAIDDDLREELKGMDESTLEDAFYCDLSFGTGGLRGVIGAGTNRINRLTIAKASQGLANYLLKHFGQGSVAISYDSRIKSDLFSQTASSIFAANRINVWLYPYLMPTPCLSYAVRKLGCSAGVMITASHNPSQYNGYKVYGPDGCQITTKLSEDILTEIERIDIFEDVKCLPFEEAVSLGRVKFIEDEVYDSFAAEIQNQSVLYGDEADRKGLIVYSPMNGTGLKPITRVLRESGFPNVIIVKEQQEPDGCFPTCPYPNPESPEAMHLGLEYCRKTNADLLLATDPDCDRCGIAVKNGQDYQLLTGNEVGLLLLDYICSQRVKHGRMPAHPILVKTIVTTDLADRIARHYGIDVVNVLTGFKYIGEVIGGLETENRQADYIFGFEESYGYLTGTYVRDKDAVNAAFMICEMTAYYKSRGTNLLEKLQEIYSTYGYGINILETYEFNGIEGMKRMTNIMEHLREGVTSIGGLDVLETQDYIEGREGLPKSNVIKFMLSGDCSVTVRPSGTEPKLKIYFGVITKDENAARVLVKRLSAEMTKWISCN